MMAKRVRPNVSCAGRRQAQEPADPGKQPIYWGMILTAPATSGTTAGFPS